MELNKWRFEENVKEEDIVREDVKDVEEEEKRKKKRRDKDKKVLEEKVEEIICEIMKKRICGSEKGISVRR